MNGKQLHEIIKARRLALGLSQKKLAERAGLSERGYINIELGRKSPTWNTLLAISEVLGLRWEVKAKKGA